jgi:hypothetical protein
MNWCLVFSKRQHERQNVAPIMLNGDPLPWVTTVKHLGNILECSNTMKEDCSAKRGKFVGKINTLGQEFYFASPEVKVKILNIYATSFYGSGLWDLFGHDCEGFYTAWNRAIRQIFDLPWTSHRYWIETVSDCLHPKVMLCSRYVKFHKSLTSSRKSSVRFLSKLKEHDLRTVLGKTLSRIQQECGAASLQELNPNFVKEHMRYAKVPEDEQWKAGLLKELLLASGRVLTVENLEPAEIKMMIDHLCTG